MTPGQAAAKLRQRANAVIKESMAWERQRIARALIIARVASSGGYAQSQLAAMDHPYAKRHGTPPVLPGILNSQTGRLRRSWRWDIQASAGTMTGRIYNVSAEAQFMDEQKFPSGTHTMIARPIQSIIRQALAQGDTESLRYFVRRGLHLR